MNACFQPVPGWNGADAAYSIPLGVHRTLWLFGDTFVDPTSHGRRSGERMVNNTAAWMDLPSEHMHFFAPPDRALLTPPEGWFWPSDGVLWHGRLWLFMKHIRHDSTQPSPFDFTWADTTIAEVSDPQDPPPQWHWQGHSIDAHLGIGVLRDGHVLYSFAQRDQAIVMARASLDDLASWRYWTGSAWEADILSAANVVPDGATEMSLTRVPGLPGVFAVYTQHGLGSDIVVRHAEQPEGPWSDPVPLYHCPEQNVMVYAAKAHEELALRPGEIVLTYCRNLERFEDHTTRPDVYFPKALRGLLEI